MNVNRAELNFMADFVNTNEFDKFRTFSSFSEDTITKFKDRVEQVRSKYGDIPANFLFSSMLFLLDVLNTENAEKTIREFTVKDFRYALEVERDAFKLFVDGEDNYPFSNPSKEVSEADDEYYVIGGQQ